MTRDKAIDVLWSMAICAVPLAADRANTDADRATAKTMLTAVALALETLGVAIHEITESQRRYDMLAGTSGGVLTECHAWYEHCRCSLTAAHDIHECECGGQWTGSDGADSPPVPVRLPQTVISGPLSGMNAVEAMWMVLGGWS